ncbi:MAG TPA: NAD-dependent epimerase/dehydratase family protein [Usitatibacter sp.]|nr:NAD-dependent epimerase/dehydratase family protein [Usitatibacter sp.]
MRMLILGGTVFLGRALTDAALAAGHDVVHFNRGTAPDSRVPTIRGDRNDEEALRRAAGGGPWDAVLDTSAYLPQALRKSAAALEPHAGRYVLTSSISVYVGPGYAESSPVQAAPDPLPDAWAPETYGGLKAACESTAREILGDRAVIVRPGLIVGPNDRTDRFTWWPHRVALGGRVAAPGRPGRVVQFIDVRDLARWMVGLAGSPDAGTFNATGLAAPVPMATLLETCREVSESDARFEWIDEPFLDEMKVAPWKDMPAWLPEGDPQAEGSMEVPIERAVAAGLAFRPLAQTVADTLAFSRGFGPAHEWKAGLDAARERELLACWDARQPAA